MLSLVYSLGWLGTSVYLVNYAYLGLSADVRVNYYFAANAVAATLLTVSSLALGTWQSAIINGFWVMVSVLALLGRSVKLRFLTKAGLRGLVAVIAVIALLSWINNKDLMVAILGWSSTVAFCGSYLLFSARQMHAGEFYLFNSFAAMALVPVLWMDLNWPVLALEVCWFVLSVIAFIRHAHKGLGLPAELGSD